MIQGGEKKITEILETLAFWLIQYFVYDTIRGISLNFKYDPHTPTWNFQMAFNSTTINFILFIIDKHDLTPASLTSLSTTSLTGTLFSSHIESHEVVQVPLHELCPYLPSYLLLCVVYPSRHSHILSSTDTLTCSNSTYIALI